MAKQNWEVFVESKPWLLSPGSSVVVGEPSATRQRLGVPALRELLERASTTPISIDEQLLELLTWERSDGSEISWLCPLPSIAPPTDLFADHQLVLAHFGGVIERSHDEPSTWLLNCINALTERESRNDASFIDDYLWIMDDHGGSWPIDPTNYYSICQEANGNTTLCHRHEGSVVLFAPDHNFDHIVPLEGCPPNSLYRIPTAPDFPAWVDAIATQWLEAIV